MAAPLAVKVAGWLLLLVVLVAVWPVTVVTILGYLAAWWPGLAAVPAAPRRRRVRWS